MRKDSFLQGEKDSLGLIPGSLPHFKLVGDDEDRFFIFDQAAEKDRCPSHPRFKLGLPSQIIPSLCQHPNEIIFFETIIFAKNFVHNHHITSLFLLFVGVAAFWISFLL
jgi:hypothetical protein